jgi:hypothetical protein
MDEQVRWLCGLHRILLIRKERTRMNGPPALWGTVGQSGRVDMAEEKLTSRKVFEGWEALSSTSDSRTAKLVLPSFVG